MQVGWFLGALGITVLPSSAVVANYVSNKFQDRYKALFYELMLRHAPSVLKVCFYLCLYMLILCG